MMVRSIATGLVFAMGILSPGLASADGREGPGQRAEASNSGQTSTRHEKFAPAPLVSEPYQRLFAPEQAKQKAAAQLALQEMTPRHASKVTCGLTMMLVDPKVDEKISQPLTPGGGEKPLAENPTDFKVRRIEPSICRD